MSRVTLHYRLKRIAERAGLSKNVFPYLFRHSRGSELYDKLPEQQAKKLMGHARDSRMVGVYAHGTDRTAIQAMLKEIYAVKEVTEGQRNEYDHEIQALKSQLGDVQQFLQWLREALVATKQGLAEPQQ